MPTKSYFLLNPSPLQTLPICWSPFKGCALSSAPPLLLSSSSSSLTQTLSLMAPLTNLLPSFLIRIIILLVIYTTSSLSISETDILIKFKDTIGNNGALSNWNPLTPPCSDKSYKWTGVLCQKGKVWGLKLEKMGLVGSLELEPLKDISSLRFLSFENNDFQGSFPKVKVLSSLKTAFFSHNKFSGELPADAFSGMMSLKKLHLAYNQFSGHIPVSLTQLNKLMEATLENNKFKGEIPDFKQQNIQLNVSSNKLEGPIPGSLSKMNKNSFSGNEGLCGAPLEPCSSKKPSLIIIIAISVVVVVVILAILLGVTILCKLKKRPQRDTETPPLEASVCKTNPVNGGGESPNVNPQQVAAKLTFLREEREIFDMHDLLKASAEILGGGKFGSTYKAALSVGSVMVVRRFKHMNNVGKEEFQEHMRRLGRLRQSNLLPLVAFYYRKEEKLLVSDYVNNVSLAVHLHGKNCKGQTVSIDWQTRLKIVKGVARALFYLYNELPSITVPHGHLKSSNVLLDESFEPLLTDYGLVPVVNQEHAKEVMTAYKSPEFKQHGRITRKMDIWSLGILILEILTGKIPAYSKQQQGKGDESKDLETWAQSVNQEELNVEMLDKEMLRGNRNCEGEMIKLLKIGFSCCEADVTKRWDIKDVVEKIEELRERDGDDDFYSSYASEGDLLSKNLK